MAYTDIGTGETRVTILENEDAVLNEIQSVQAKEVVVQSEAQFSVIETLETRLGIIVSRQNGKIHDPILTVVLEDFRHRHGRSF